MNKDNLRVIFKIMRISCRFLCLNSSYFFSLVLCFVSQIPRYPEHLFPPMIYPIYNLLAYCQYFTTNRLSFYFSFAFQLPNFCVYLIRGTLGRCVAFRFFFSSLHCTFIVWFSSTILRLVVCFSRQSISLHFNPESSNTTTVHKTFTSLFRFIFVGNVALSFRHLPTHVFFRLLGICEHSMFFRLNRSDNDDEIR